MNITFVIHSLEAGGAERVVCLLASELSVNDKVTIVTLSNDRSSSYPLSRNVRLIHLCRSGESLHFLWAIVKNVQRIIDLRLAIKASSADVVLPVMLETNVLTIFATLGLKLPIIAAEHTDPVYIQHNLAWRFLRRVSYHFLDHLVVLNDYMASWFGQLMNKKRISVIPNPVKLSLSDSFEIEDGAHIILAAGRLVRTKRFDLMLSWFSEISDQYSDWRLVIAGTGDQERALQAQIEQLGISGQVQLIGHTDQLHDWMHKAELFISTSELEAFPMAICEAMLSGLPIVSTSYNEAADDFIGSAGIVSKSIVSKGTVSKNAKQEWLHALKTMLDDPVMRQEKAINAKNQALQYRVDLIAKKWRLLLSDLVAGSHYG